MLVSPSSPMVESRLIGWRLVRSSSSIWSGVRSSSTASSSGVGSRPSRWCMSRSTRLSLDSISSTCTGSRMVRAASAKPRWIACRIHHIA